MKIEIAQHDRMSESGSSLLRLIQNQDMPLLDLLVRESVQNSLDAAKSGVSSVNVDFKTGSFKSTDLNKNFEKIEKNMNSRFPVEKGPYEYIEVRDINTNGLTGPVKYEDVNNNDFGNLLKLVYEICKPQQNEGAGGSWGLGKTIYFRLGIGLVIYYSRIKEKGKYKSRLAACFVEDETKNNSIIPYDSAGVKRGIAWWGTKDKPSSKHTVPIENEKEIISLLNVFGIDPFTNDETGTSVIIPYINKRKLLDEVYSKNEEKEHKPAWTGSVEKYIEVAIQRWYAPRIENDQYKYGAFLSSSINNKKIKPEKMLPLFRVIRELYIHSTGTLNESDSILLSEGIELKKESVSLRSVFSKTSIAGEFSFVKLTNAQLYMTPPDNEKDPYHQITNKHINMEGGNAPVIMYTRRPGMIVGYDYNGTWTNRMPHSSENEYIIGLFVLNSGNILAQKFSEKDITLEEYIRQGEKADHASWADRVIKGNNYHIVANIQKHVIKNISKCYSERITDTTQKKNIGLGHALADMLLPANDFGRTSGEGTPGNSSGGGSSGGNKNKSSFVLSNPSYSGRNITYDYELVIKSTSCCIELVVVTDFKKMKSEKWESEDEIGLEFPLSFIDMSVHSYRINKKNSKETSLSIKWVSDDSIIESDQVIIVPEKSAAYGVISKLLVSCTEKNVCLKGRITFRSKEPSIKGSFDIKEA